MPTQLKPSVTSPHKISVRWWKNAWNLKAPTHGTLFFFHGIGEHSGRYEEFARYFSSWGFDVLSFDLPGHGLTARKGGYERFADFDEMRAEAKDVLRYWMLEGPQASRELRAKPLYFMGHSLGSILCMYYLMSEEENEEFPFYPKRALANSLPVALQLKVPFWKEWIAKYLQKTVPDLKLGNEISKDELSHDVVKTYEYIQDSWRMSKASPRLYISMKNTMEFVRSSYMDVQLPLMLISVAEDKIIDHTELKNFYEHLNTHKKWIEFKGMRHETLNEIGREKVYEEVVKWFLH